MRPNVDPSAKRKSSKSRTSTGLHLWYLTLYSFLTLVFLDAAEGKVPGEFLIAVFLMMFLILPVIVALVIFKKIKYNSLVIYVKVMSVLLIGGILCDIL